jgi:hypothetical protein
MGFVPVNAFVIKGTEPILVDTGTVVERPDFMTALRSVIDPADLRWIWLTHTDADHIGSLHQLLAENPRLRVITTFLGVGIMSLSAPLPMDRVNFVNPGDSMAVGDRTLTAVKPPVFDNHSTTGFYRSRVLFRPDCWRAAAGPAAERRRPWTRTQRGLAATGLCRGCTRSIERFAKSERDRKTPDGPEQPPAAAAEWRAVVCLARVDAPSAQPFVGRTRRRLRRC